MIRNTESLVFMREISLKILFESLDQKGVTLERKVKSDFLNTYIYSFSHISFLTKHCIEYIEYLTKRKSKVSYKLGFAHLPTK